jgi:hypothetical protein
MNNQIKNSIRAKARLIYGLLNVLEYDIDNLRSDVNTCEVASLMKTIQDTNMTLENLIDIVAEIEYLLYLHNAEESL